MNEVVFRIKRKVIVLRIVAGFFISVLGAMFLYGSLIMQEPEGVIARVSGWTVFIFFLVFVANAMSKPVRMLFLKYGLKINQDGFHFPAARFSFIPWSNVKNTSFVDVPFLRGVKVELRDMDQFLNGFGPIRRLIWNFNYQVTRMPLLIVVSALENHDDVLEMMERARNCEI